MTRGSEETFRQKFRGLSKVSQRGKVSKDIPYEDPREFGRRVAVELFEKYAKESGSQESSEGEIREEQS